METRVVPTEGVVEEASIEGAAVMVVLTEEAVAVVVLTEEAVVVEVLTEVQGKCIKRFVQNAIKNVRFLLNQQKANQYIVENVFRNININLIIRKIKSLFLFSYLFSMKQGLFICI